jgi:Arc/MetJ-type ribon-helix-helix transcriptional regulator
MHTGEKRYVAISLPKELVDLVKTTINRHTDYSSVAEFVKDATRRRLEELGAYGSRGVVGSSSFRGGDVK